jgi:hypothetical protein
MRLRRGQRALVLKETLRTVSMHEVHHRPPVISQRSNPNKRRIDPFPKRLRMIFNTNCRVAENPRLGILLARSTPLQSNPQFLML